MTFPKPMTFHECCRAVIAARVNMYATAYATAGLSLRDDVAVAAQALYILSNLTHWRTPLGAQVRANLRRIAG
jgi:hypothetical protein